MERQLLTHGFGPFAAPDSRILILGSFPSVKSREAAFFYGHPRNRFWQVIAAVTGEAVPGSLDEKKALLARRRIALYDVIESCTIVGSADSTIRDVVPADIAAIIRGTDIGRIFVNGSKAGELYDRLICPALGIPAVRLPSTSPANAAWSLEKLTEAWKKALN